MCVVVMAVDTDISSTVSVEAAVTDAGSVNEPNNDDNTVDKDDLVFEWACTAGDDQSSPFRNKRESLTLHQHICIDKQACAAEIAVLYAALACKQNKRYRTSARLTKTRDRCSKVSKHGTDGQTDRQTDRQSATQYAAPLLRRRAA